MMNPEKCLDGHMQTHLVSRWGRAPRSPLALLSPGPGLCPGLSLGRGPSLALSLGPGLVPAVPSLSPSPGLSLALGLSPVPGRAPGLCRAHAPTTTASC